MTKYNEREIKRIAELCNDVYRASHLHSKKPTMESRKQMWICYVQLSNYIFNRKDVFSGIQVLYVPFVYNAKGFSIYLYN